jgi:hypothetical protein
LTRVIQPETWSFKVPTLAIKDGGGGGNGGVEGGQNMDKQVQIEGGALELTPLYYDRLDTRCWPLASKCP